MITWACDCGLTVLLRENWPDPPSSLSVHLSPSLCLSLSFPSSLEIAQIFCICICRPVCEKSEAKDMECNVLDDDTLIFFSVSWKFSSKQTILKPWSGDQRKLYSKAGRNEITSNKHNCTIVRLYLLHTDMRRLQMEIKKHYWFSNTRTNQSN